MKLYLVQHGEACTKAEDPKRPLTQQGKVDVNRLAVCLRKAGVKIDRAIHSGALRSEQTAERVVNAIARGTEMEINRNIRPNDNPVEFANHLAIWTSDTLVVGHMPFLGKLVSQLTLGNSGFMCTYFLPSSVVCLERHHNSQWTINWMLRPEVTF